MKKRTKLLSMVCSCAVLPLFAGIWKRGAGFDPAIIAVKWFLILLVAVLVGCVPKKEAVHLPKAAPKAVEKPAAPDSPAKPAAKSSAVRSTKDIKELETALKAGVPVVVKLGSDSCYPCRMMNPVIAELAVEQDGKSVFLSLDVYQRRDLVREAGVRVIPTILFYDKHGKPKAKREGFMDKIQLLKAIDELELKK